MGFRTALLATAIATTFGLGAVAQTTSTQPGSAAPQQRPDGQQVNPSPMPPGSRAGDAAGMGSTGARAVQGAQTGQANPTSMPPGSTAGNAPGMNPGPVTPGTSAQVPTGPGSAAPGVSAGTSMPGTTGQQARPGAVMQHGPGAGSAAAPAGTTAQGNNPDRGQVGGMGAQAPSGQPDVARGTAPATPGSTATTGTTTPGMGTAGTTGAATLGMGAQAPATTGTAATTGTTTPGMGATGGGTDATRSGALVSGANSFTEGQARSRISDAGFTDVQGLRKDDEGIWRGTAMRNGQQVGVGLDFQGNVVATQ
jgi:putative membrane protein